MIKFQIYQPSKSKENILDESDNYTTDELLADIRNGLHNIFCELALQNRLLAGKE